MRKKQAGQAFIFVLILLAIGALLVVPALRLSITELKSSQIVTQQTRSLYAVNAAQEWVMWSLSDSTFRENLPLDTPWQPEGGGIDICGTHVNITIIMRAVEGTGGITLAMEHKIKPTKTVDTGFVPNNWVPDKNLYDYAYIIKLDYLSDISDDNPKVGLDAIYDFLPAGIDQYIGPTELRVDDGEWMTVPDPDTTQLGSKGYIKWPDEYDKDTHTGTFSSNLAFYGIEDFEVSRQVKELRFTVRGRLADQQVHGNWVVLKMDDGTNTLSGPQAPITVGMDEPEECLDFQVMEVTKESSPKVILPDIIQEVTYVISITNMYTQTRNIETIIDYLPPGFRYVELLDSKLDGDAIEILEPDVPTEPEDINGELRYPVQWSTSQFGGSDLSIGSQKTLEITFKTETTQDVSGSYYNELIVLLRETGLPPGFSDAGITIVDFASNYSWNTGEVMVPAYDSEAEADGMIINANLSLIEGGIVVFSSWQIR